MSSRDFGSSEINRFPLLGALGYWSIGDLGFIGFLLSGSWSIGELGYVGFLFLEDWSIGDSGNWGTSVSSLWGFGVSDIWSMLAFSSWGSRLRMKRDLMDIGLVKSAILRKEDLISFFLRRESSMTFLQELVKM